MCESIPICSIDSVVFWGPASKPPYKRRSSCFLNQTHEATSNMKLQNGTCGRTCSSPVLRSGVLAPDGIHHSSETRHTKIQLWCSKAGVIAFPPPQTSDGNTLGQLCRCRCRCPRSRALAALHTLHPLCAEVLALVCRFLLSFEGQHVHFVQLRLVP